MSDAEHVEYRPGTALLVVDVQNDFADPKGSLYVKGGEEVVPIINRQIDRALVTAVPADTHAATVGPAYVHPRELLHEPAAGRRVLSLPRAHGDGGVARLARVEPGERGRGE